MTDQYSSAQPRFDDEELHGGQFDARLYNKLRELIHEAATDQPQLPVFLERLNSHGVQVLAQMTRGGRVTGVNYAYMSYQIKASTLGTEYTWSGLQRKLGVHYVMQRDNPLLTAEALTSDGMPGLSLNGGVSAQGMLPLDDDRLPTSPKMPMPDFEPIPSVVPARDLNEQPELSAISTDAALAGPESEETMSASTPDDGVTTIDWQDEDLYEEPGATTEPEAAYEFAPTTMAETRSDIDLTDALHQAIDVLEDSAQREQNRYDMLTQTLEQFSLTAAEAQQGVARSRQELWRVALSSAAVAGLSAALVVGVWMSQRTERAIAQAVAGVVEHMDQQATQDPVRNYFERLVRKHNNSAPNTAPQNR